MKIAVTYEAGMVFQHFGHTAQFKIYEVMEGDVVATYVLDTGAKGHGALAGLMDSEDIDVVICGGIGMGAQVALAALEIKVFGGVSGSADQAVEDLLRGRLVFNPQVRCSHHDHEEGHSCGEHGCGHDCGGHCGH